MKAGNSFLRPLTFLGALLVLAACSDQGERPSTQAPVVTGPPEASLVIRHDASGQAEPGWKWMKLDASQSKGYGAEIEDYYFVVRDAASGRVLPGPGQSGASVVRVLLPEGAYEASLRVRDGNGEKHEISRPFGVGATQAETSPPVELEWKLGVDGETDPVVFHGRPEAIPHGIASSLTYPHSSTGLLGANSSTEPQGASPSTSKTVARPTPTGEVGATNGGGLCGTGNWGNIVGGFTTLTMAGIAYTTWPYTALEGAALLAKNTKTAKRRSGLAWGQAAFLGTSSFLKIASGSKGCATADLPAMQNNVKDLDARAEKLEVELGLDEMLFTKALKDVYATLQDILSESLEDKIQKYIDNHYRVLYGAALRDEDTGLPWLKDDGSDLDVDWLAAAACNSTSPACCAGALPADDPICLNSAQTGGPLVWMQQNIPEAFLSDALTSSGAKYVEDGSSKCTWECWKQFAPDESSLLVSVLEGFKERLYAAFEACTAKNPRVRANCPSGADPTRSWEPPESCTDGDPSGCPDGLNPSGFDVIPFFDLYNDRLLSRYQIAADTLSRAHQIEQMVNIYNFNRYLANKCSSNADDIDWTTVSETCSLLRGDVDLDGKLDVDEDANGNGLLDDGEDVDGDGTLDVDEALLAAPVSLNAIPSYGGIGGTRYHHDMLNACNGPRPVTLEDHTNAFHCAQHQLNLAYLAVFNTLFRHLLNYHFTDSPSPRVQKWPNTEIEFPPELSTMANRFKEWTAEHQGAAKALVIDYAEEVGRALPSGRETPRKLIASKLGLQTYPVSGSSNWAAGSVVYQSPYLWDMMACVNDLLKAQASTAGFSPSEKCTSYIFDMHDDQPVWGGRFDGNTLAPVSFQLSTNTSNCPASCQTCSDPFDDSVAEEDFVPGGMGLVDVSGVPTCGGYCAGADNLDNNAGYCGDYRYATGSYADCTSCLPDPPQSIDPNDPYSSLGSVVGSCDNLSITPSSTGVPQLSARCGGVSLGPTPCPTRQWGYDSGSGTLVCETLRPLQTSAVLGGNVRYCASNPGPPNSGYGFVTELNHDLGNKTPAPVQNTWDEGDEFVDTLGLGVICDGENRLRDSTVYFGKKYVNSIGESPVSPGSGDRASLLQMISEAHIAVPGRNIPQGSFSCSSDDFKARFGKDDPAPGFAKQCLCASGNRLEWIRPDKTVSASWHDDINERTGKEYAPVARANLPYLACGSHDPVDSGPRIAWEYGRAGGSQAFDQKDKPPTVFHNRGQLTRQTDTFETDIGFREVNRGEPIHYEVAYTNLYKSCDKTIHVKIQEASNQIVYPDESTEYLTNITGTRTILSKDHNYFNMESASNDYWAFQEVVGGERVLTFDGPSITQERRSGFASVMVALPARGLNGTEIKIPIDLVRQCSNDGADECEKQSTCMYMVTHSDGDWKSASQEERANALAKRGYICQQSGSERRQPPDNPTRWGSARMVCEVPDGRAFQIALTQRTVQTGVFTYRRYADIYVTEVTDYLPGRP